LGVRFGVDASGNAFFRRPQGNAVTYAEGDDGIVANYVQVTGEEIFDIIELEYADEIVGTDGVDFLSFPNGTIDLNNAIPIPLRRSFTFGDNNARRVVPLSSPEALMNEGAELVSSTNVTNPSGPVTGGTATFGSGPGFGQGNYQHVVYDTLDERADGVMIKMTINPLVDAPPFQVRVGPGGGGGFPSSNIVQFGTLEGVEIPNKREFVFIVVPASNYLESVDTSPFDFIRPIVRIDGDAFELSNLQIYVPDVDVGGTKSEQFASGFVRDVQENVAEVKSVGELGQVADRVNWTPTGESQVTVPVERIQYTLTTRDGLVTTYELGQAYDAEALSQRKVLKDLAREAVSE